MFLLKPWYVFRPRQIVRRLLREFFYRNVSTACVELPWKAPLKISPNSDDISSAIWTTGIYDLAVSEVLWRLTPCGGACVDAGANIGYMTNLLACKVGSKGRVFAFEPHPKIFELLTDNLALLRKSTILHGDVKPYQKALSQCAGSAWLSIPPGFEKNMGLARISDSNGEHGFDVETVRLDDVVESPIIDVMKIDVEGHEASVLAGADRALSEHRIKNIVFEEHGGQDSPSFQLLENHGYQVFQLGWKFSGPRIAPLSAKRICKQYEAPNYVATINSEHLADTLSPKGWHVLSGRKCVS